MVSGDDLIPWSSLAANSSRMRAAIRDIFGNRTSGNGSYFVDHVIRVITDKVNSGGEQSPATVALLRALYGILICSGIATNLFILGLFMRKPKLRNARNMFIVSLCSSDILLCAITMPFTLKVLIEAKWTLGLYLCKLVPLIQCSNILVNTSTVIVIALDRYKAIVQRQTGCQRRSAPMVFIGSVWAVSLAIASPLWFLSCTRPFSFPTHRPVFALYEVCTEEWPTRAARLSFTATILLLQYVAPLVTLSVTHARVTRFLRNHLSTADIGARIRTEIRRNRRVTLVLTLIVVVFAISWLPFHLFIVLDELGFIDARTRDYILNFAVCHLLAMSTAISNPVLYGLLNTNFQREWQQLAPLLFRWCARAPQSPRAAERRRESCEQAGTVTMISALRAEAASATAVSQLASDHSSPRPRPSGEVTTDTQV